MNSKNRTQHIIETMQQWKEGQVWEFRGPSGRWHEYAPSVEPLWDWQHYDYRLKPAPITRPMRFEELPPIGTHMRSRDGGIVGIMLAKYPNENCVVCGLSYRFLDDLATGWEWKDATVGWSPFTITESTND